MTSLFGLGGGCGDSEVEVAGAELVEDALAQGADVGRRRIQFPQGAKDVRGALGSGGCLRQDLAVAVLQSQEAFAPAALAAFRAVFAVHLDKVERVVDHGGVRYSAADTVGVAYGVQVEDVLHVDAA